MPSSDSPQFRLLFYILVRHMRWVNYKQLICTVIRIRLCMRISETVRDMKIIKWRLSLVQLLCKKKTWLSWFVLAIFEINQNYVKSFYFLSAFVTIQKNWNNFLIAKPFIYFSKYLSKLTFDVLFLFNHELHFLIGWNEKNSLIWKDIFFLQFNDAPQVIFSCDVKLKYW